MAELNVCSVDGCDRGASHRGYCGKHYERWRKHGDPRIQLKAYKAGGMQWLLKTALPFAGNECLIWPFARNKYGRAVIRRAGKVQQVSRIICETLVGQPPSKRHEAAHSCGKGHMGCVAPNHLRWATPAENAADKIAHGTHSRGERHNHAKLRECDVRAIRKLAKTHRQRDIAKRFGVRDATIDAIVKKRSWSWLDE